MICGRTAWLFLIALPGVCPSVSCAAQETASQDDPPIFGPAVVIEEHLNGDRRAAALAVLRPQAALAELAAEVAGEVSRVGDVGGVDVTSEALSARLRGLGYDHRILVVAYAIGAEAAPLVARWPEADPATWERLMDPDLRDLAIARGDTDGGPFFLLLAATSQNDAKALEAAALEDLATVRREVLERTNELRRERELVALRPDSELDAVAQAYADDMLRRGFYGHESPEGQSVMDRLRAARVPVRRSGENLAEGPPTAESVVQSWYESPNHRRNLLHAGFRRLGVGLAAGVGPDGDVEILWVQVFTSERRPVL